MEVNNSMFGHKVLKRSWTKRLSK